NAPSTNVNPPQTVTSAVGGNFPGNQQAFVLRYNNNTTNDLFVIGDSTTVANTDDTTLAARIGYLFVDNSYAGGAAYDFRAKFSATSKFYSAVGDYNNDGFDYILIGISHYDPHRVGRVYMIPVPVY